MSEARPGWVVGRVAALGLALAGAAAGGEPAPAAGPPLVSAAAAAAVIVAGGDVVVLDAGWPEDHEQRRVRGARLVHYGDWLARNRRDPAADDHLARWQTDLAALGIGRDTRVLIHGGRGSQNAPATVWYALQNVGVARVSVIDGGFEALAAALPGAWLDFAALPAWPQTPPAARDDAFVPGHQPAVFAPAVKADVLALLEDRGAVLLDARSAVEFSGLDDRRNPRPGRIPGSVNLPHAAVRTAEGLVLAPQEIRRLLADHGVSSDDRIVVSCQGGGRSAFLALALAHAGFRDVRNYFGSFGEWSRDPDCPVETEGTAAADGPRSGD